MKRLRGRKIVSFSWEEGNDDGLESAPSTFPSSPAVEGMGGHVLRVFTKRGAGARNECFKMCLGCAEDSKEAKRNVRAWLQEKNSDTCTSIL